MARCHTPRRSGSPHAVRGGVQSFSASAALAVSAAALMAASVSVASAQRSCPTVLRRQDHCPGGEHDHDRESATDRRIRVGIIALLAVAMRLR